MDSALLTPRLHDKARAAGQIQDRASRAGPAPSARPFSFTDIQIERPDTALASAVNALSSSAEPLDAPTRIRMEQRFGQPFEHVRIHTDPQARAAADALGAEAYTAGSHIVFGSGYQPGSSYGEETLSHELGHVAAADRTGAAVDLHRITPADHPSESQAESASRSHAAGPLTAAPPGISLRRKSPRIQKFRASEGVVEREGLNTEILQLSLRTRLDAVGQAAQTRLLKMRGLVDKAIEDFEKDARVPENKLPAYSTFAVTTLIPAVVQTIRIVMLDSPYPKGERGLGMGRPDRMGGRYHLLATGAGVLLQSGILAVLLAINASRAAERQVATDQAEALAESVDFEFSNVGEAISNQIQPFLDKLAKQDDVLHAALLNSDISAEEILDMVGFPIVDAKTFYLLVRSRLEKEFTAWLLQSEKSHLFPGLFREREGGDRFKAEQEARKRAEADYARRFKGQP